MKLSPHALDSGYMGSPYSMGSPGGGGQGGHTPSPSLDNLDQVLDLTNIKKRALSPEPGEEEGRLANSYRRHKMKMHKSGSSTGSGIPCQQYF